MAWKKSEAKFKTYRHTSCRSRETKNFLFWPFELDFFCFPTQRRSSIHSNRNWKSDHNSFGHLTQRNDFETILEIINLVRNASEVFGVAISFAIAFCKLLWFWMSFGSSTASSFVYSATTIRLMVYPVVKHLFRRRGSTIEPIQAVYRTGRPIRDW